MITFVPVEAWASLRPFPCRTMPSGHGGQAGCGCVPAGHVRAHADQ
jgi:hypothetical protein